MGGSLGTLRAPSSPVFTDPHFFITSNSHPFHLQILLACFHFHPRRDLASILQFFPRFLATSPSTMNPLILLFLCTFGLLTPVIAYAPSSTSSLVIPCATPNAYAAPHFAEMVPNPWNFTNELGLTCSCRFSSPARPPPECGCRATDGFFFEKNPNSCKVYPDRRSLPVDRREPHKLFEREHYGIRCYLNTTKLPGPQEYECVAWNITELHCVGIPEQRMYLSHKEESAGRETFETGYKVMFALQLAFLVVFYAL